MPRGACTAPTLPGGRLKLDTVRGTIQIQQMPIVDSFDIDPATFEEAEFLRCDMPRQEFAAYCYKFGLAVMRGNFHDQQQEYLARTMHEAMAAHQRNRAAQAVPSIREIRKASNS